MTTDRPGGFLSPSEPNRAVRALNFFTGGAAVLLVAAVAALHRPDGIHWTAALVLGLISWGANSQGLAILQAWVLSLEVGVYLFAALCFGFPTALVSIFVGSILLAAHGMWQTPGFRRLDFLARKLGNTFVLGISLWGAMLALGLVSGPDFLDTSFRTQLLGLTAFWVTFTLLNNLLFLPHDAARSGWQAVRDLPREMALDGSLHALSILLGTVCAMLYHGREVEVLFLLLPTIVLLVVVLRRVTERGKNLRAQMELLRGLNEWSAALHRSLDLSEVLDVVGQMSAALFGSDTFFVALLDDRSSSVQIAKARDHGSELDVETMDLGKGLTGQVIRSGEPLFVSDMAKQPGLVRVTHRVGDRSSRVRSVMMAPLVDNGRCIGVYSVQRDEPSVFRPFHQQVFLGAIRQIATAVVVARLFKRATQDGLTHLFNKSFFEEKLGDAVTSGRPFGLIFMDCDDFKAVNDRFGHTTGDRFLQVLSQTIQLQCRSNDLPCRYGGDEFAVLLRDASPEQCLIVAQRLLDAARQTSLPVSKGVATTTLSIGALWSSGEKRDIPVEDVIRRVDAALYEAKSMRDAIRETRL